MQEQPGDGGLELNPNGCGGGLVGQGALALAAVKRQANLAGQPLRSSQSEVDLDGNGQAGELPDLLDACRIAVEDSFVDDESRIFIVFERAESGPAALRRFALPAQQTSQGRGAVFRPF